MIRYRSNDPKEKEAATMEMIDGLSDFIGNIALKMYKDFARNDQVNEELMQTGKIAIIEAAKEEVKPEAEANIDEEAEEDIAEDEEEKIGFFSKLFGKRKKKKLEDD